MPQTREIRISSPEKLATLSTARDIVVAGLKGNPADLGIDFLRSFGLLVRSKKELGPEAGKAVDGVIHALREDPEASGIRQRLKGTLAEEVHQISEYLQKGRLDEALKLSEATKIDKTVAHALGLKDELDKQQELVKAAEKAQKELEEAAAHPADSRRRILLKGGLAVAGAAALGGLGGILTVGKALSDAGKEKIKQPGPTQKAKPTPAPTQTLSPTATIKPTPEPSPTTKPTQTPEPESESDEESENSPEEEIGDKNLIEFFLGNYTREFQGKGATLWEELPEYRDRVQEKYAKSENITIAYLGIDDTRQRPKEFNGAGWGRADVIMIVSFNPRTLQTSMISLPRDLLSPEVLETGALGDKINAATMTDYLKALSPSRNQGLAESKPLMAKILETATGLRIDGLFQTNIDFMQGYVDYFDNDGNWIPGKDGIFNKLFPNGLRIVPKRDLRDTQYPGPGYSYLIVDFKKGQEYFMDGWELTQYGRMRHADSDYGRSERQREIAIASVMEIFPKIILDLSNRHTHTLDQIIEVLEEQKEVTNLFEHDIDIANMLSEIRNSINDILSKPNSGAILARLFTNSSELIRTVVEERKLPFTSFGLSTENLLTGYNGSTTIMKGSERYLRPNQYGNYTDYWRNLREWVDQNVPYA